MFSLSLIILINYIILISRKDEYALLHFFCSVKNFAESSCFSSDGPIPSQKTLQCASFGKSKASKYNRASNDFATRDKSKIATSKQSHEQNKGTQVYNF